MSRNFIRRSVVATTATDGSATVYLPDADASAPTRGDADPLAPLRGEVMALIYEKVDFADGVDFSVTAEGTGLGLWTEADVNASKAVHPMVPASNQAGVSMLFAAAGESVPAGPPVLAEERIKITVTSGGNTRTGKFTAIVG